MTKREILILSSFFLLYFLWFALPTALSGSEDIQMMNTFDTDEADLISLLREQINDRNFNIKMYDYGHLYYNTGLLPLIIIDKIHPVSDQFVLVFFRLLSALFFSGTIIFTFLLAKKFFGSIAAWFSSLLLFFKSTELGYVSTELHPDTAQLFFIAVSLYACCTYLQAGRWKWLVVASVAAGFAFGTKYGGILLMPVIFISHFLNPPAAENYYIRKNARQILAVVLFGAASIALNPSWIEQFLHIENPAKASFLFQIKLMQILCFAFAILNLAEILWKKIPGNISVPLKFICQKSTDWGMMAYLFFLAFAFSTPGGLINLNFVDGYLFSTAKAQTGHWFNESLGFEWLKMLGSAEVAGCSAIILTIISVVIFISGKKKSVFQSPQLPVYLWFLIFMAVMILKINSPFKHYLLPVVPALLVLAGNSVEKIGIYFSEKFQIKNPVIVIGIVIVLFMGYDIITSVFAMNKLRNELVYKVENSDAVKAGFWLRESFSDQTKILHDRYCYVPPQFRNCTPSWGISQTQIFETMPELIFIHSDIYQCYMDANKAEKYKWGKDEYLAKHNLYDLLLAGNSDYKLLKSFGKVTVYTHKKKQK